ncbi:unnamed protein product [Rotaria sp. Silwood1]|nr:unnamed protein product [Rotaria sp. Silwood1]CAF0843489.1 unnamed protein product [Rotaria sp. Silwood1]CAF3342085.1 unnamed protein product [Rotaria sp. Silwood1]CAF3365192.1 unnamed protein product [Rotaria sp. Silwood1]CAF4542534.1 unnamed protein product [Rotaria sp. Silwood1]
MNSNTGEHPVINVNSYTLPDVCIVTSENQPLLLPSTPTSPHMDIVDNPHLPPWNTNITDDPEYADVIRQAERAIEGGILPARIAAGSSGSYFVRNLEVKTIGVFKPKDEEPYGRFNPKWTKWLHKTLCPCCFGRGCLVPNQGYLSEAGASIIDAKLHLNIVPKTRVVRLAADSFNYPAYQRHLMTAKREINESVGRHMHGRRVFQLKGLHPKVGSFQLFVENYVDADVFLKQLEHDPLLQSASIQFQRQFERLVVLDYIIRNTDRNNGNWLVKYEVKKDNERDMNESDGEGDHINNVPATITTDETTSAQTTVDIRIAAIDNGLAFPFKHPDEWRTYPFHWAWLPQAKTPFSDEIKSLVLPLLSDMNFVQHELCDEIQRLFSQDKNYDRRVVERQLSVMRGQILNLAQAMRDGKSPFQLVQMPGVIVERLTGGAHGTASGPKQFKQKFNDRYPLFSCQAMSCTLASVFASLPRTTRGQPIVLGADPKGKTFLYTNGNSVFIRNIEDPSQCEVYTEHSTAVQCAKYSPSGSYIASADGHGKVRIWGADNKEHILKNEFQPFSGCIKDLAWTSDNQRIIVGGEGKEKFGHVFSADAGNSVGEISGMTKAINSVDFKPTRPFRAITGSEDNAVSFFEGPPFKWKTTMSDHEKFVHVVRYSPDGEKFASGAADGRVILYDGKTGERLSELGSPTAHTGSIYGLCWDSTSRFILTASGDKTAKIWDITTGSAIQTYTFGTDLKDQQIGCLWSGNHILSVSLSGQITYLDRDGNKPSRIIRGHNKSITALTVARNESQGTRIFSASHDGLVVRWSIDGKEMNNITGDCHTNQVQSLASNSRGLVASIGLDDTLRLLNSSWESYDRMEKLAGQPRGIAINDSNIIFIVCGSAVCMYREQQGVLITHPLPFEPTSIAVSPQGTQIAVGGKDNKTHIFTVDGTALNGLRELEQRDIVVRVAYSPDGRFFASADNMKNITCYQLPNFEPMSRDMWRYHAATVTDLAFSPDGKKLASVAIDTHLMIYQTENITKVTQVKGAHPLNPVTCLTWLDNDTLLTGGNDCCLRKWTVKC